VSAAGTCAGGKRYYRQHRRCCVGGYGLQRVDISGNFIECSCVVYLQQCRVLLLK
jgi:hypothetical protein